VKLSEPALARGNPVNKKRTAFTLMELLVVIAIVAVLAAVLLPVFARVRERGRQTVCQSNLRQLGLATFQYVQDNDGLYPRANWEDSIGPYVNSPQVWLCPSQRHPHDPVNAVDSEGSMFADGDYFYNFFRLNLFAGKVVKGRFVIRHEYGINEDALERASETVLSGDTPQYGSYRVAAIPASCGLTLLEGIPAPPWESRRFTLTGPIMCSVMVM